jgi:signal transduction histidine kinase
MTPQKMVRLPSTSRETGAPAVIQQRDPLRVAAFGVAGCIAVGLIVGFTASAGGDDASAFAAAYGVLVAAPLIVGLVAWHVQGHARFAQLLVALGALFSLTAFSQSADETLYSVGRVAVWFVEPGLFALILAFPSGRLLGRWDRRLAVAMLAVAATLYVPTALVVEHFPEPSPWSGCDADCPSNAFALVPGATGFVEDVVRPLRELLAVVLLLGVAVRMTRRLARSPRLLRRALTPVVVIAAFQVLAFATYQWGRRGGTVTPAVEVVGWIFLFSLPAVAFSFAAGLANRRLHVASTLQRLALRLPAAATPIDLRDHLAEALEDPSVRVAFWIPDEQGGWVDEAGVPTAGPRHAPGRALVEVRAGDRRLAVIDHDEGLAPDSTLIDAAAAYGLVVLQNGRLIAELQASLRRVSELEIAGAAATAAERRRIERDLHDGAQQRLLALRINLELLREQLERDAPAHAAELHELAEQADEVIHVVRTLAHGMPPALLVEAGLGGALQVAAAEASLPTTVRADGIGRYDPAIEGAVYFSCVEALQNAVKHAHGATQVMIELAAGEDLRFEVRDDGPGFSIEHGEGAGLRNIRDRLAAVGGRLEVDAQPGRGARVVGTVPMP